MNAPVTKIQKFSLHDGPGIRTTVFLEGCSLNCNWCQNPETIKSYKKIIFYKGDCLECGRCLEVCEDNCFHKDSGIIFDSDGCNQCGLCIEHCQGKALGWSSRQLSADDVFKEVLKDKSFYDASGGGLTISGGEPLTHPKFCLELALKARHHQVHVAIDTCGQVPSEVLGNLMDNVDLFLFDLKFIDENLHLTYTHSSNKQILRNFTSLVEERKKIEVRVPMIPGITDTPDNLAQIKKFVRIYSDDIKIIHVPFNPLCVDKYKMIGKKPPVFKPR